jgi:hypothetical protein
MGAHGLTITVQALDGGCTSKLRYRTDGNDRPQPQEVFLDEGFVAQVRETYAGLDLTKVDSDKIVAAVVYKMTEPEGSALVTVPDVERALTYLLDTEQIMLPSSKEPIDA